MHIASSGQKDQFIENVEDFRRFMRECRQQIENGFKLSESIVYGYSKTHATYANFGIETEVVYYFTGNRPGSVDMMKDGTPAWQSEYGFHKGALGIIINKKVAKKILPRAGKDVKVIIPRKGIGCLLLFGDDITTPVRNLLAEAADEGDAWWEHNGLQEWLNERIQKTSKSLPTTLPPSVIAASEAPVSSEETPQTE